MRLPSQPTERAFTELAARHGFGVGAVAHAFEALVAGGGGMAQFSHPDLGGAGQWMRGGMTMVSDLSDGTLRRRVAALCEDLATLVAAASDGGDAAPVSADWWGADLGRPDSTGAQNGMRYAFFASARRLAVEAGGRVTLHDTGEHAIAGFAQQQGGGATLRLTGRHGPVDLAALPVVDGPGAPVGGAVPPPPLSPAAAPAAPAAGAGGAGDVLDTVERLAALRDRGVLTDAEFAAKKAELLARL